MPNATDKRRLDNGEKRTRRPMQPVKMREFRLEGKRIGNQVPTVCHIPEHDDTSRGDKAIEFLRLININLDEWQEFVLRNSLAMDTSRDRWAATEVGLIVPRQQGKTVIVEARELVGLFLFGEQTIIHTAQLFSTAKESFLRQWARIREVPDLMEMVHKFRTGNDNVSIELRNGSRLLYQARGSDPTRGYSADLVVYDEAYGLDPEVIAASMMTLSARPNPQVWYASSTGMEDSEFLLRVRERGLNKAARLAFFEWSADPGCDPKDREQWYKANPALGIRLTEDFIESEGEALEWGKQFKRERLGLWADNSLRDVIDLDRWRACQNRHSQITGTDIIAAVDVSPNRSSATIAVCGIAEDGRRQLEAIQSGRGVDWIVDFVGKFLMSSNPPVRIAIQSSGSAASIINKLEELGCELYLLSTSDIARATGEFVDAINAGHIVHLGDPLIERAIQNATRYSIGSKAGEEESPTWGFARKNPSGDDITPIVACCYAHYGMSKFMVEEAKEETPHFVGSPRGGRIW